MSCRLHDLLHKLVVHLAAGRISVWAARQRIYAANRASRWPTVQKFDVPLADATTSSLEARKACSLGRKLSEH